MIKLCQQNVQWLMKYCYSIMCTYLLAENRHLLFSGKYHCMTNLFFKAPITPEWLLLGSPMVMDHQSSQQHAGLHYAV